MKLPFYLELIENETIEINTSAEVAHQRLYKIFKQRNQRYGLERRDYNEIMSHSIIPTNVFYDFYARCFKILISDDRRTSKNNYVKSYYARLKFIKTENGKSNAEVNYVFNHGYAFCLAGAIILSIIAFLLLLILPIPSDYKVGTGIAALIITVLCAINIYTEKKRLDPDLDRLHDAVEKYTDMINRWDD